VARFTLILVKIGTAEVLSEEVSWCQFQVVAGLFGLSGVGIE